MQAIVETISSNADIKSFKTEAKVDLVPIKTVILSIHAYPHIPSTVIEGVELDDS